MGHVDTNVVFRNGVRQALAWALATSAQRGYVSPSVTRLMGAPAGTQRGLSLLELHGEAALIIALIDRQPEAYQAAIWFRAGVLPRANMESLAVHLAPHIIRMLPTGIHNRRAVQDAILKTAGLGPGCRALAQTLGSGKTYAAEWAKLVADALDRFGLIAEADVERELHARGWV